MPYDPSLRPTADYPEKAEVESIFTANLGSRPFENERLVDLFGDDALATISREVGSVLEWPVALHGDMLVGEVYALLKMRPVVVGSLGDVASNSEV